MPKSIIIFLSFIFIISCISKNGEQNHIATCTVTGELALCKIPITPEDTYKYFRNSTSDNVSEYDCDISVGQYRFGFSLFKFPGSKEQKGSIETVLRSGQTTIWRTEGNSFSAVEGHGLEMRYLAPFLVAEITNPSTIDLLFKEHPPMCSFRVAGFKAPKCYGDIEIKY
jgi:hypothetical protein